VGCHRSTAVSPLLGGAGSLVSVAVMTRRAFMGYALLALCSFKTILGCGRSRTADAIERINEMMRHMVGVEDRDVVLFQPAEGGLERQKTAWYAEIVDYAARHYRGQAGVDYEGFFAQAANHQVKNPTVSFALDMMRADAITAFYTSPEGWRIAGYQGPPVKSTWVHVILRKTIFPSCNLPCHALINRMSSKQ